MVKFFKEPVNALTKLLAFSVISSPLVYGAPAPVPEDDTPEIIGNPGLSSHSWCTENREEVFRIDMQQDEQKMSLAIPVDTGIYTMPDSPGQDKGKDPMASGYVSPVIVDGGIPATKVTREEHKEKSFLVNVFERFIKRQGIQPSNPCRHPNPIFPDEGPPSHVEGCNQDPLDPAGFCPRKAENTDCTYFCEERRDYFYGKEQRWLPAQEIFPYPDAPPVTIGKGEMISLGVGIDYRFQITLPVLSVGLGVTLQKSWTWTNTRAYSAPKWDVLYPYCAFFTFVPKMVRSCGTVSKWPKRVLWQPMGAYTEVCNFGREPETIKDACVEFPWRNAKDEVEGVLMLVKVECGNEQTLAPPCQQDKKFLLNGVMDETLNHWNMSDPETQRWLKSQGKLKF
ncbi:hypothetical protein TWF788_000290 [Orbilia oligospora]|uniref:Uncharacterized protein n=1 Tax=Orbilia oligospora TaxID=2813651 RepID=A0A6G1MFY5_ORBOL|nr:hypothetical protein TWF788_000290 [Orbilia oligospora]KAF3214125.1 hypothetical protein TWF679_004991 [Orbilia oligospora]KAF3229039.1 hypothetical protein TWF191_002148 [Orbilia oligospora]KAF3256357.1 hypothetical protein TWF192_001784 [Orbilia oligospora]